LKRENNNFDILRLIAACTVIVGHAHALVPLDYPDDLVSSLLHFDYSGSLAVKFFFFLSGLVVANSLLDKPHPVAFGVARVCRLMPALIVSVVVCAIVVGPLATTMTLRDYFADPRTWSFIRDNVSLTLQWDLPGAFASHRNTAVNGSLWTSPIEVFCYLFLAALGFVETFRHRSVGSTVLIAIVAYAAIAPTYLAMFGFNGSLPRWLPVCFACGAFLAVNKQAIHLRSQSMVGLVLLCVIFHDTDLFPIAFYAALFYGSILAAASPLLRRMRLPGDFSYGVYLYGFPLQQLLVHFFPKWSVHENQVAALAAALLAGGCSWYLIERPAIRAGRRLNTKRFGRADEPAAGSREDALLSR
jgi:peptidoglycan/LPS O-acetylase OafA/YrhL